MTEQTDNNVGVIRRAFEALNRGDLDAWESACDETYVVHFPGAPGPLPRAAARQTFEQFFAGFPGLQHDVADAWGAGDRVAARLAIHGTHTGPFQGMPATGRQMQMEAINIFRLAHGRVVEQWIQYDALGMLQQLGMMPGAAQPEPTTARA